MIFTFYPANAGTPIIFSTNATDYKLLRRYNGWAYCDVDNITMAKAPGQHGVTPKDDLLNQREISFEIMIQSADFAAQQALVSTLATALNPIAGNGILKRTNDDGSEYLLYCKPHLPKLSETDRSLVHQRATIEMVAQDPFIYGGNGQIIYLDPNPGNFFPFPSGTGTWPFTLSSALATQTATNAGQAETPVSITFAGPMTNPALTLTKTVAGVVTTEVLSMTITLAAGDTVVINTDPDIMTARFYPAAGGDINANAYIDVDAVFWQLGLGSNSIHLTCTTSSTGAQASVQWSNRYLGI